MQVVIDALRQICRKYGGNDRCYSIIGTKAAKSIFIFDALCARVVENASGKFVDIETDVWRQLQNNTFDASFMKNKIRFSLSSEQLSPIMEQLFLYALNKDTSERFGCCSHYIECSDKKWCVHDDLLFARSCGYFRNLRAGKIFYGENCNYP